MRIENNNNVSFGAYFKENKEFKRLFSKKLYCEPEILDKFTHTMPPHEIEIIKVEEVEAGSLYTLFNNHTKQSTNINTGCLVNWDLDTILRKLTSDKNSGFWSKNDWTNFYNKLTNKQ